VPIGEQLRYWGLAAVGLLAVLWLLGDVLLPFLLGAAIAYLLDPFARRLVGLGLSRLWAVVVIGLVALLAVIVAGLLIVPVLIGQALAFIQAAPDLVRAAQAALAERVPDIYDLDVIIDDSLAQLGEAIRARGTALAERALASLSGAINMLLVAVITPVAAFYLMLDWDKLVARIDDLLPRDHAPLLRRIAAEIDRVLAGFIRGQMTVCLILAAYYGTTLGLTGLNYGLVIGVVAGLVSFIPYVGALTGGLLSIGVALWQFWDEPLWIGVVVAIFVVGQLAEGNWLVPRLVGGSVGLHPVWLLLALSAFGALFGFAGLLVAVPVAAALGVLVRFAAGAYRDSALYRGSGPGEG
jgi:predicted PurR-regulated permease PerM